MLKTIGLVKVHSNLSHVREQLQGLPPLASICASSESRIVRNEIDRHTLPGHVKDPKAQLPQV